MLAAVFSSLHEARLGHSYWWLATGNWSFRNGHRGFRTERRWLHAGSLGDGDGRPPLPLPLNGECKVGLHNSPERPRAALGLRHLLRRMCAWTETPKLSTASLSQPGAVVQRHRAPSSQFPVSGKSRDQWFPPGHWLLVTGHWLLVTGYWLSAAGNWSPAVCYRAANNSYISTEDRRRSKSW